MKTTKKVYDLPQEHDYWEHIIGENKPKHGKKPWRHSNFCWTKLKLGTKTYEANSWVIDVLPSASAQRWMTSACLEKHVNAALYHDVLRSFPIALLGQWIFSKDVALGNHELLTSTRKLFGRETNSWVARTLSLPRSTGCKNRGVTIAPCPERTRPRVSRKLYNLIWVIVIFKVIKKCP